MASRELKVEIVGDSKSLERAFGRSSKSAGGLQRGLSSLAKAGLIAGAALGAGLVVGVKKSIDAASNLEEQVNKTNVVFRGSQKQVLEWSKGLESSFGLSQRAALEAAGTYGNMLVPMGLARDKAGQMSERMVELAGDMASFNNASPADTLAAIQSGLAGQARPLRQYGVFLSEARTQQEALTETGKKNAKQLTDGEKAIARYNLILKDTKDTQGDFARTAGTSLENQLRTTKAMFEDLAASIGTAFLPIANKALEFLNKKLIPGLGNAAEFAKSFWEGISNKLAKAPNFRAKVQIVFTNVEMLAKQFVDGLIGQVERLLPQKPLVLNPRLEARGLGTKGGGVDWDAVAADMIAALAVALQQSVALTKALGQMISDAIDQVDWVAAGQKMGPGFAEMLGEAIKTILDPSFWIKNWELTLAIATVAFGGTLETAAAKIGAQMSKAFLGIVSKISPTFAAALGRLMADAGVVAARAFEKVGAVLFRLATAIFGRLTRVAVFVIKVLGVAAAIGALEDFARAAVQKIKDVIDWFKKLPAAIKAAFAGAGTWLYQAGVAIIQGLWDGLKSKWDAVAGWLGGLGGKIRDLKGPPAKDAGLLRDIGQLIMKGLADGLNVGWTKVEDMLSNLSPKLKDRVSKLVQAMQDAITAKQGAFASAFEALGSAALDAFDKITSQFKTRSEKALERFDLKQAADEAKKRIKELKDAVIAANNELAAVQAKGPEQLTQGEGESQEEFQKRQLEAQQRYLDDVKQAQDNANRAQQQLLDEQHAQTIAKQRAALEKRAENERKAYENSRELQRRHFEEQLSNLESALEKGNITAGQFRKRVIALFDKFDVPFQATGKALGKKLGGALAEGLQDSFQDAVVAARKLIDAIADELKKARFIISIEVDQKGGKEHRAMGGPVRSGSPYIVGERGPELFVPKLSGTIVPSLAGMGGGTADVTTQVYLDGSLLTEVVRREMLRFEKRNGRSAV